MTMTSCLWRSSRCSSCSPELMRALRSHTRHLATLARAITRLGRAAKTVHLLDYCNDPHNRRTILGKLNRRESRHDLARQAPAAPAAAQLLGARRSATRAGRPALGRHVTRDQPSGGARCVPASEPSRLLSRPVHSLHRQAERATVPGDAFESSPSYVRFLGPELRRWHGARGAGARTSRRPRWKRCSEHGHPAITEPNAGAARRNRRAESARSSTSSTRSAATGS